MSAFSGQFPETVQLIGFILGLFLCLIGMISFCLHALHHRFAVTRISMIYFSICFLFLMGAAIAGTQGYREISKNAGNPLDGFITIECLMTKLPMTVPPSGSVNMLQLFYHPDNSVHAIGVDKRSGEPGSTWEWDWMSSDTSYRCTVKNYADKTAFNITAKIRTTYYEIIHTKDGGWQTGKELATHEYLVNIPALKSDGNDAFEFYIYNASSFFACSAPLPKALIRQIGDKKDQEVVINYSSGTSIRTGMNLPPNDISRSKIGHVAR